VVCTPDSSCVTMVIYPNISCHGYYLPPYTSSMEMDTPTKHLSPLQEFKESLGDCGKMCASMPSVSAYQTTAG
jgi:hypothetical protein